MARNPAGEILKMVREKNGPQGNPTIKLARKDGVFTASELTMNTFGLDTANGRLYMKVSFTAVGYIELTIV